ncbi:hypothetical protein M3Y99_00109300 [Aphelenchoides fujianensis]|nr:hypothetical protein M3Y99_00109300 [Aphelenchoides fujianensis]
MTPVPPECLCGTENFCFKSLDERGGVRWGRRFDCRLLPQLRATGLTDSDAKRAPPAAKQVGGNESEWTPVFVTSVSSNHFREARAFVRNIRAHYPRARLLLFDIGMKPNEASFLSFVLFIARTKEARSWCKVEVRAFNFSRYPPHVARLQTYAFKLAIVEAFQEHKTFFYFDSSIRINGSNLHEFLRAVRAGELPPHQTVPKTIHSVWATMDPGMRVFLPLPLIVAQMWELQSPTFLTDAPYTRHVLKWWLLCAWTRECIDPPGAVVKCRPKEFFDLRRTWIGCHRYDQAGIPQRWPL